MVLIVVARNDHPEGITQARLIAGCHHREADDLKSNIQVCKRPLARPTPTAS